MFNRERGEFIMSDQVACRPLNGREVGKYIANIVALQVRDYLQGLFAGNSHLLENVTFPVFSVRLVEGGVEVLSASITDPPMSVIQNVGEFGVCVFLTDHAAMPEVAERGVLPLPDEALSLIGQKEGSEPDRLRAFIGEPVLRKRAMPQGGAEDIEFEIPGALVSPLVKAGALLEGGVRATTAYEPRGRGAVMPPGLATLPPAPPTAPCGSAVRVRIAMPSKDALIAVGEMVAPSQPEVPVRDIPADIMAQAQALVMSELQPPETGR